MPRELRTLDLHRKDMTQKETLTMQTQHTNKNSRCDKNNEEGD